MLVSALEFTDADNDWHRDVQRRADRVAADTDVAQALPVRLDRRRVGAGLVAIAAGVALSLVPPIGGRGAVSAADQAILEAEAARLMQENPFSQAVPVGTTDRPVPTDPTAAWIIGTAEQVTEAFKQFTDVGVKHFIIRFADVFPETRSAELFAEQVTMTSMSNGRIDHHPIPG